MSLIVLIVEIALVRAYILAIGYGRFQVSTLAIAVIVVALSLVL